MCLPRIPFNGVVARFDGRSWSTMSVAPTPGLNGIFMDESAATFMGGVRGFAGRFDVDSGVLFTEESGTEQTIHAVWADGAGRTYFVGGSSQKTPCMGIVLERTKP